jgi:hypothetical protein
MAEIFEAIMLICFGFAWPMSIYKLLKTKSSKGKSLYFLGIIIIGYIAGIIHELIQGYNSNGHVDYVTYLYLINIIMVSTDLYLSIKYRNN